VTSGVPGKIGFVPPKSACAGGVLGMNMFTSLYQSPTVGNRAFYSVDYDFEQTPEAQTSRAWAASALAM